MKRFLTQQSFVQRSVLLALLATLLTTGLSACYVVPLRDRDGGYHHDDREYHRDGVRRDDGRRDDERRDDR